MLSPLDAPREQHSWTLLILTTVLLFGGAGLGCQDAGSSELTDAQEAALTDTIRAQVEEIVRHHDQLDADALLQHYSDDVQSYILGDPYSGAEFRKWYRGQVGAFQSISVEIVNAQVNVLSPRSAVASYRYQERVVDTTGREIPVTGVQTLAFERQEGTWKVVQFHAQHVSPDDGS